MTESADQWSDYIVYVDESGDHSLTSIDSDYPVFVLAFCIFHKKYYAKSVVPAFTEFKFEHFGHDMIVLHEHDIRKEKNGFKFKSKSAKLAFMAKLGAIIEEQNFIVISVVIDKNKLAQKYSQPENPYHLSLNFCLERLFFFLKEKQQQHLPTPVVVEMRGKKEDIDLELEFRRICDKSQNPYQFNLVFADKKANSPGLQLADLVARPIGLSVLRPDQPNMAFETLKKKLYTKNGRKGVGTGFEGYGLKRFP